MSILVSLHPFNRTMTPNTAPAFVVSIWPRRRVMECCVRSAGLRLNPTEIIWDELPVILWCIRPVWSAAASYQKPPLSRLHIIATGHFSTFVFSQWTKQLQLSHITVSVLTAVWCWCIMLRSVWFLTTHLPRCHVLADTLRSWPTMHCAQWQCYVFRINDMMTIAISKEWASLALSLAGRDAVFWGGESQSGWLTIALMFFETVTKTTQ